MDQQTQPVTQPMELPGRDNSSYGDGDIPEIDLPGAANASPDIPQEFPERGMDM